MAYDRLAEEERMRLKAEKLRIEAEKAKLAKNESDQRIMMLDVITATPRQLESVMRLNEALARIRFSEEVEKKDVVEPFRLLEVALKQSATDPATGTIDMDLITTGVSSSERMKRDNLVALTRNIIMERLQQGGPSIRMVELLEELKQRSEIAELHLNDLRNALGTLAGELLVDVRGDSVTRV
ncbi:DNA replication licensing factor MCM4-like [Bidens hawaiensis]|uniref:DNA replication licensing factor MCM4-like n=1 Tax=Bidens hawaiensis TaxID=980011 RepID=UPI004049E954